MKHAELTEVYISLLSFYFEKRSEQALVTFSRRLAKTRQAE